MSKESLKERLKKRRKAIEERGSSGSIIYPKEGTIRFRSLPVGEDEEFGMEVLRPYFGKGIVSFTSAATFGEHCSVEEAHKEAKASGDTEKAKSLSLRKKYLVPVILYKDLRGKEVDTEQGVSLLQVTSAIYGEMIDSFLDPEWGDFTDTKEGYDFKLKRVGTGLTDTTYTITAMKPSPTPKAFTKEIDLEKMIRATMVPEDEVDSRLQEFMETLGGSKKYSKAKGKRKAKKSKKRKGDM